ncbi:phytoene desaturase family protein [Yinghuangia soli]|uniref:Pyridine nucleotide-disulfide oxidoreductase domain-containing protein 2 n=1 Tax=Yinghuangia soli TaxID=2908204 RepID=A0AA41Q042_9ACTN|nr:NAD(P)/FAD-dependent oxidoreductase [Yinghuangia soli]MCF2528772.1 NAD(P)/FAD-dependent oxidoreductase [Yinghuangia soli]
MTDAADADAVIVGAGPNGLVAANILADAGWRVLVLEAQPAPGGAVRSDRGVHPDFVHDLFSAFHPLAVASPAIAALGLHEHGLRWSHAPAVLAHPLPGGRCAVVRRGTEATATGLERSFGAADADAWRRLAALWDRLDPHFVDALLKPFPPVRTGLALAARLKPSEALRLARFLTLPVRRLGEEEFTGPDAGAAMLLAGCALHADLHPEAPPSTVFGWLLAMLGEQHGWPAPVGGAGALTDALVRRLESRGGAVRCGTRVASVVVRRGTALGVVTADGDPVRARKAVLADVAAPALYGGLVSWDDLPPALRGDMRRFQWDLATFKVDWALDGPIPWEASETAEAGTVHLAAGMDELSDHAVQVASGRVPAKPFVMLGQMTTADPTRSPAGTESVWAYTHVPRRIREDLGEGGRVTGSWDESEAEAFAARVEAQVERFAPGWTSRIVGRRILTPPVLESMNENLVDGALNGGTAAIHQQLFFRPVPGTGGPGTPVKRLFLASASAHPGGGVHGACGANAARAALRAQRLRLPSR